MADTSEKGVVRVESLAKHYGPKVAVQNVSLQLKAGEIVGLLGPNGAGKTTTFYMVVGLIPATAGKVFLELDVGPRSRYSRKTLPLPLGSKRIGAPLF